MDKMAGFKRQKPLVDDDAEEEEEADKLLLWTMTNGSQQLTSLIVAAAEADQARPTKLDRLAAVCSVLLHDEEAPQTRAIRRRLRIPPARVVYGNQTIADRIK